MPNSVIVQGYEQIQAANRKLLQAMQPSGALGKAVLYGTQQMQKGTTARAHVDTGTYKASQTADVHGLIGTRVHGQQSQPEERCGGERVRPLRRGEGRKRTQPTPPRSARTRRA
jgi:hypothetical protein